MFLKYHSDTVPACSTLGSLGRRLKNPEIDSLPVGYNLPPDLLRKVKIVYLFKVSLFCIVSADWSVCDRLQEMQQRSLFWTLAPGALSVIAFVLITTALFGQHSRWLDGVYFLKVSSVYFMRSSVGEDDGG